MSDHTPTTEEVRCAYIADFGWHAHDSGADFDCWYAKEIRKAKTELLEKIIEDFDSTSFYRYADGSEGHFLQAHQSQAVRDRLLTYTEEP